jgi:hypothetical protein
VFLVWMTYLILFDYFLLFFGNKWVLPDFPLICPFRVYFTVLAFSAGHPLPAAQEEIDHKHVKIKNNLSLYIKNINLILIKLKENPEQKKTPLTRLPVRYEHTMRTPYSYVKLE